MAALTGITDFVKKQPLLTALVTFIVGVIFGLTVLGWWLLPVQWANAGFADLHPNFKQEYVRLVASAYVLDGDLAKAKERIAVLGPNASSVISDTLKASTGDDATYVTQLRTVLEASGAFKLGAVAQPSLFERLRLPFLVCGGVVVIGLLGGFLYLRMLGQPRGGRAAASKPSAPYGRVTTTPTDASGAPAPVATPTGAPPVARFMTTYTLGDDVYDDSFSVDGPDGNFLGECGMGISETIGVGDPKKVTAFEVWLFDKNDIRTVTKVLMSDHAFRDEGLKSRLAAKGEPVLAAPGDTVTLDTATLIVTARVVDMAYGGGALPPNSFFERLTIELAAFKKPTAS